MGICATEFSEFIIRPTLERLGEWSEAMEALLLGTAAQASQFGYHIKQDQSLGVFQLDSKTHRDVWDKFLAFDPDKASLVRGFASQREFLKDPDFELITNLTYSTAIALGVYAAKGVELPKDSTDLQALAEVWHSTYPKRDQSQNAADFIESYRKNVSAAPKLVA